VFHLHDFLVWPVKVIGEKGYLPVEPIEGVADYSPTGATSVSNLCSHLGHVALIAFEPLPLIRW
jgi:hypothetical protein